MSKKLTTFAGMLLAAACLFPATASAQSAAIPAGISAAAEAAQSSRVFKLDGLECTVFLPEAEKATGRAVVVLPGGAYVVHADQHEGKDWAPFFNDMGIAVAVLNYTFPKGDRNLPMNDVKAAFKALRDNAKQWGINPSDIGIMGSSAGGHLASTMATHMEGAEKPAFQILFYPVISLDPAITHAQSRNEFLGAAAADNGGELETKYSNEKQVTADSPRAIIFYSGDDNVVPPMNGVLYYEALLKAGVPSSLHIYPSGGHGWGYGNGFPYQKEMMAELAAWLRNL